MSKAKRADTTALKPSPSLLCKLGSIVVHCDEMLSPDGHEFDRAATQSLLSDPEVVVWMGKMDRMAMLPVVRRTKR